VRERQAGDGQYLHPADLVPAVPSVAGVVAGGYLPPGQRFELSVQAGLICA
jgi:hypothetical protein